MSEKAAQTMETKTKLHLSQNLIKQVCAAAHVMESRVKLILDVPPTTCLMTMQTQNVIKRGSDFAQKTNYSIEYVVEREAIVICI